MRFRTSALAAAISLSLAAVPLLAPSVTHAEPPPSAVTLGHGSAGIAVDPLLRRAFVTNYDDGTLAVIDLDSRSVIAVDRAGGRPGQILSDAAGGRLYFVNETNPGYLTVFDAEANAGFAHIAVGIRPRNLAADFGRGEVYVANHDSATVSIVDVRTNAVAATLPVGSAPGSIGVDALSGRIYVTSGPDGTVTMIDAASREVVKTIAVGTNPGSAAVDERTGKVYVNNIDDRTVSVIDPRSGEVARTIDVGAGSTFGTVSGVYRRYYLPNAQDGTLSIVDTDDDRVMDAVPVGASPQQAFVDADAGVVYVVARDSDSVTVVDARSESVIGSHAAGTRPWRLAVHGREFLVLSENGATADSLTIASGPRRQGDTAIAVEYHDKASDRYFHTADALERRLLADGLYGTDVQRTTEAWRIWTAPGRGRFPVCRFAGSAPGGGTSYFYTFDAGECEALKSDGKFRFDGVSHFVALPDSAGECPFGTVALYRTDRSSGDGIPDQRFTVSLEARDAMLPKGWIAEGSGSDKVFACTPPLRGRSAPDAPDRLPSRPPLPRLR